MHRAGNPSAAAGEAGEYGPVRVSPDGRRATPGKFSANGFTRPLDPRKSRDGHAIYGEQRLPRDLPVWFPDRRTACWQNDNGRNHLYVQSIASDGSSRCTRAPWTSTRPIGRAMGNISCSAKWALERVRTFGCPRLRWRAPDSCQISSKRDGLPRWRATAGLRFLITFHWSGPTGHLWSPTGPRR